MFGNSKRKQFEAQFRPHLDAAYNLAHYLCRSAYDAEDIVQEAYLRAYRAFDEYADGNSRAWILTITRNTCYSWMRRHATNLNVSYDQRSVCGEVDAQLSNSDLLQSPEQIAASDGNRKLIRRAIESLPIEFREVTVLRELEGLSYREIGQVLDIPEGTVMSRLARARLRLRKLLVNVDALK